MLQAKGRDTQSDQNKYTHGDRILEAGTCAKDTAAGRASESWDEEAQAAAGKSRHVSVRGSRTEAKLNHSPEADHALSKPCAAAAVSLRPPAGSGVSPLLHRLPGQLQAPPRDPAHPAPDPRSRLRHAQSRPRGNGARLVFLRLAGKPPTRPLRMFVSVSTTETSFSIPVATMTPLELPRGARSNLFTPRLPLPRPPATYACFSPEKIWVFLA